MANVYDSITEKENQIAMFQAEICGLQAEIEALRLALRLLAVGSGVETARQVVVQTPVSAHGDQNKRFWP